MEFREWLKAISESHTPTGKTGLYPLGYGGIGLYPPSAYLPANADAITYLSLDDRIYKGTEGKPHSILHIPGRPSHDGPAKGEGPPHKITHIPGKPSHSKPGVGDGSPHSITHLPK